MFTVKAIEIFNHATLDFKKTSEIDQPFINRHNADDHYIESLLYRKSWIDTVQWRIRQKVREYMCL